MLLVCRQNRYISRLVRLPELGEQAREVERLPAECDRPVPAWPLTGVPVPGQLDPVEIRIVQVDGLVGAVIGRPVDRPAMIEQAFERDGQICARRIVDGEVVQASRAGGGWCPILALPGVEADVVVVATSGEKGCALEVKEQVEAQVVAIKADRALQVGDLEVDMSDTGLGRDGCVSHDELLSSHPSHLMCVWCHSVEGLRKRGG